MDLQNPLVGGDTEGGDSQTVTNLHATEENVCEDDLASFSHPEHIFDKQSARPASVEEVRIQEMHAGQSSRAPLWTETEAVTEEINKARSQDSGSNSPLSVKELKVTMLTLGWCPHQIDYLLQIHALPALRKFASIDRRTHRAADHLPCREEKQCVAFNTDEKDYHVGHATDCPTASCDMVKVPYKKLISIIKDGGVPLVSIRNSPKHGLSLRVHRRGFRSNYATISHVWADGLGNPMENALPTCHLKHFQSLLDYPIVKSDEEDCEVNSLGWSCVFKDTLQKFSCKKFWMDTLCIPVKSEHDYLKARCIDNMASIYAVSSRVFVLDKELMATSISMSKLPAPWEPSLSPSQFPDYYKALYQISCSIWMTRSWTLQEGILPEHCLFQFADQVFQPKAGNLGSIEHDVPDNVLETQSAKWAIENNFHHNFLDMRKEPHTEIETFISTWNALAGRGSSKAADLYVVLPSCLNFKLHQLREFPTSEEKMERIVLSFQELPFSLFLNSGRRLYSTSNHHNRWIPADVSRDLLMPGSTFMLPHPRISKYSDHGMHLELKLQQDVSVFLVSDAIPPSGAYIICANHQRYQIRPILEPSDDFETTGHVGICIVVEKNSVGACETLRGACFYVTSFENATQYHSSLIEMVYFCPLVIVASESPRQLECGSIPQLVAREVRTTSRFWIKFSPIPGFKPLKRQIPLREVPFDKWGLAGIILYILCVLLIVRYGL